MRHPAWIVVVTVLVVVGLMAFVGCSHKRAESGGPSTDVTQTPPAAQPPATPTPDTGGGEQAKEEASGYPDVYFAYDDATLGDDARGILARTGAKLAKNSEKIEVQGHCDERGSVEYNLALGERRAASVKDYLVSYGIGSGRIGTVSYGKERPADSGHDEAAWAKNRRAHFVVR